MSCAYWGALGWPLEALLERLGGVPGRQEAVLGSLGASQRWLAVSGGSYADVWGKRILRLFFLQRSSNKRACGHATN
eukprot:3962040-Pyramimonas_sp.AAC.1